MKRFLILTVLVLFCAASSNAARDVLLGHVTTCSGLINNYPADSTNWFFRKQHKVVQYFAYMLFPARELNFPMRETQHLFINPYIMYSDETLYEDEMVFENRWITPSGDVISEKIMTWTIPADSAKKINVSGREYVPYVFTNYIGIKESFSENGQEKLPAEKGLYHIELYLNGDLLTVTFFELKD
ncbi:MAG: hypothetical protein ACLFP1_04725 [Candidatus Goldiibacteriota bacterium]